MEDAIFSLRELYITDNPISIKKIDVTSFLPIWSPFVWLKGWRLLLHRLCFKAVYQISKGGSIKQEYDFVG
jgi:hypothetical protein